MMSLAAFIRRLGQMPADVREAETRGLRQAARVVEAAAKEAIGDYQPAVGPFPAWAQLADSTKADRVAQGYSANDPLLRSGDLRAGIDSRVSGRQAAVGSNSEVAVYQELGTARIPPRPFLGPALYKNAEEVARAVGESVARAVAGKG